MSSSSTDAFPGVEEVMLEFRAGKMSLEGKQVVPDTRKGLVRIARGEEGLVHFQWLDRTENTVEDDQIIFPDEAVFKKVEQSSERVYILRFNDGRKFFFWMQEPSADIDYQLCSSVNEYINKPLELMGEEEPAECPPRPIPVDMAGHDFSSRDAKLVVPNLGVERTSDVASSGPVKLEDLQRILSNIKPADERTLADIADTMVSPDGGLGLGDILKPDLIMPLMETLPLEQRLAPYLPEGKWSTEDILELLQSPPFRQQVDSFTYVLRTGQVDLSQFEIDPSKYKFTVLSFLEALEDSVSKSVEAEDRSQSCNRNDPMDESQ